MPEAVQKMSQQLTDKWSQLNKVQKTKIGLLSLLVITIISFTIMYFTASPWVKLIDVAPEDSQTIIEKLSEKKIDYKLQNNAQEILVKEKDKDVAILAMAEAGFPKGGYDLLSLIQEKSDLGTTTQERNLKHQKALQTEIERMIKFYPQVEDVSVNLVLAEDTDFINQDSKSSAGVYIKTNEPLSSTEAKGIAHLITSSVKNLNQNDVSIVADGKLIYGEDKSVEDTGIDDRYSFEKAKERDVENKIKEILTGFDDVKVASQLKLNFDKQKEQTINYSPVNKDTQDGAITEETTSKEEVKNGSGSTTASGVTSNPGASEDMYPTGSNGASEYKKEENTNKKVWNESRVETDKAVGDLVPDQSSVAVTVFKDKVYDQAQIEKAGTLKNMTWEQYQADVKAKDVLLPVDNTLIEQIKSATGIQNVSVIAKERPVFVPIIKQPLPINNYFSIGILALLLTLLAIFVIRRNRETEENLVEDFAVNEMLKEVSRPEAIGEIDYTEEGSEVKKQINKFVDEKPEAVAQLLRNWLSEEWE